MERQRENPNIIANEENCVGCLSCELRCSFRRVKAFSPADAAIQVRRLVGGKSEFGITITEDCDRCGVCVKYCLYGALLQ